MVHVDEGTSASRAERAICVGDMCRACGSMDSTDTIVWLHVRCTRAYGLNCLCMQQSTMCV